MKKYNKKIKAKNEFIGKSLDYIDGYRDGIRYASKLLENKFPTKKSKGRQKEEIKL